MAKAKSGDVIFHRGKNTDHEDIWDDSVLIEAYERAASMAYDTVCATMQSNGEYSAEELTKHGPDETATNKWRENHESVTGNTSGASNESPSKKKGRKKRKSQRQKWQVGDKCLAKYSEDGQWYKATVIALDRSHNQCTVRYAEYENEEDVNLGTLQQWAETSIDEEESSPSERDEEGLDESEENMQSPPFQTPSSQMQFNTIPLLPPPMPPHLLRHNGIPQEDEALSSMLMSWYTSGYHTGYYQAMRDMKRMKK